ncbi:hypothetical protein GOAMI_24_00900 [Gordonia amicalis NBRC 100051 = JCM 11271]|nr:hypothetical protein GOAMI_24_00900 [Gordonia amicalis NBRC 100051 = JCM 11271]
MAIRLEQAGIDYILIDKNTAVGGTWHENVYPGCGVDTPSYLYALSFDPKPDWSSHFASQHELAEYWRDLAERHGVLARTRFSTMVDSAAFDSGTSTWTLTVRSVHTGEAENLTATAVVSAVGLLNQPSIPDLPGLQDFDGPVLHTARWDPEFDLRGKRVAVVGTGASAMQFVPAAAEIAAQVRIFQRSPQWAMPHPLKGVAVRASTHWLNEHVPFYLAWYPARLFWRMGDKVWRLLQVDRDYPHLGRAINKGNDRLRAMLTAYIESELSDRPDLLEKSLPDYPPYGKRLLIDAGWFRTLRRDNVDLITTGIETITPNGVATTAGTTFEADVIVLATGFRSVDVLGSVEVRGRDGRTLREVWGDDDGRAHLGITVPGFPNFFCLYGPNTNTGHGATVIAGTEMQIQHVTALLATMIDDRLATIEVRPEAYEAYNRELDEALADTRLAFRRHHHILPQRSWADRHQQPMALRRLLATGPPTRSGPLPHHPRHRHGRPALRRRGTCCPTRVNSHSLNVIETGPMNRTQTSPEPVAAPGISATTLVEAFQATAANRTHCTALTASGDNRSYTWGEYRDAVEEVATGLASLGVSRGDTVALMVRNSPEFHILDMAVLHLGATPFSIYLTSAPNRSATCSRTRATASSSPIPSSSTFSDARRRPPSNTSSSTAPSTTVRTAATTVPRRSSASPTSGGIPRTASTSNRPGAPSGPTTWRP